MDLAVRQDGLHKGSHVKVSQHVSKNRAGANMNTELQGRAAYVAEIRERAETDMRRIGIDAAFIEILVETFYRRIRNHPDLGPIFDARLAGKWPDHMGRMKRFWSSVALRDGSYGGKPVQAHQSVDGLTADLFPKWLQVFSATLDDIAPSSEAHDWFMATAERIARSLTLALFYNPALDAPTSNPA
jgi:hemoglobin